MDLKCSERPRGIKGATWYSGVTSFTEHHGGLWNLYSVSSVAIQVWPCCIHSVMSISSLKKKNIHRIMYHFFLILFLWLSSPWHNVCKVIYPRTLMWALDQFISGLHEITFLWVERFTRLYIRDEWMLSYFTEIWGEENIFCSFLSFRKTFAM